MPFSDFYRNRRVLVTGHTGFKGSWLSMWLQALGAEVTGLALEPETTPNLFTLAEVGAGMSSVIADVRDYGAVNALFDACRPDVVFHLAAQPLVRRSYREPRSTFDINVQGTVNLLEAVRETPSVSVVAVVTSDKCYENYEWPWGYRENDRLGGHDPYSASKAAAEIVVGAYRRSFFDGDRRIGVISLRAGNVIGGGDFAEDRLIPDAVRALESPEGLLVRAPNARRPWQHVLDPLGGYLALSARAHGAPERYSGAWNFGPSGAETVTVAALVDNFYGVLGQGRRRDGAAEAALEMHEAGALKLAVEKAAEALGWSALYSVDEAVAETAKWYRRVLIENGDPRPICEQCISDYVARAGASNAWWG